MESQLTPIVIEKAQPVPPPSPSPRGSGKWLFLVLIAENFLEFFLFDVDCIARKAFTGFTPGASEGETKPYPRYELEIGRALHRVVTISDLIEIVVYRAPK
jgi:hypothetical protein